MIKFEFQKVRSHRLTARWRLKWPEAIPGPFFMWLREVVFAVEVNRKIIQSFCIAFTTLLLDGNGKLANYFIIIAVC